jgi:glycine/D-amino acid oxidase-like deaminating enzyme
VFFLTLALQVTSMKGAKGAISVPACSLWPYKFVSQLLARLVEKDLVNLQTRTPVTKIREAIDHSILETPRGSLQARKVVFATNAYTAGLCDTYLDRIVPYKGTAVHISPSTLISPHLSCTYNINYAPKGLGTDYMNPRPSGGIVVGGGKWTYAADRAAWNDNWDDSTLLPSVKPHFDTLMQRHFRGWEESGAEVSQIWTGIQASTADAQPHVGTVPGKEGLHYVLAGFNGGGMAYIPLCAEGIAKMIAGGVSYEETGLPAVMKTTADRLAAITK